MVERAYYVEKYTDEVLPCAATLEGWAQWLSKPDPQWPHPIPEDGEVFDVDVIRFEDDLIATQHDGNEWTFSRELAGTPSILAVRFGTGLGWEADSICDELATLREFLAENGEGEERIAVGYDEPPIKCVYRADPPRLIPIAPS